MFSENLFDGKNNQVLDSLFFRTVALAAVFGAWLVVTVGLLKV